MDKLINSELFMLFLVVGVYLLCQQLFRKTRIALLHPLLTATGLIILFLKSFDIPYESFKEGSSFVNFLLGPSVVALGYVLYEQIRYIKGNVISILTSIFVGSLVGIVSVMAIAYEMGADNVLIASLQPKSVTTPIAMGIAEKAGGIPSITAVVVVAVGIFGSIIGPVLMRMMGIDSKIAKGLALGASAHGLGTSIAIQMGAIEGAISGLAIGLMGVMTALLVPVVSWVMSLF